MNRISYWILRSGDSDTSRSVGREIQQNTQAPGMLARDYAALDINFCMVLRSCRLDQEVIYEICCVTVSRGLCPVADLVLMLSSASSR